MAVIREDVVQVSYEINGGALNKVNSDLQGLTRQTSGLVSSSAGLAKPFNNLAASTRQINGDMSGLTQTASGLIVPIDALSSGTKQVSDNVNAVGAGLQNVRASSAAFTDIKTSASGMFASITEGFAKINTESQTAANSVNGFVNSCKAVDAARNSISQFNERFSKLKSLIPSVVDSMSNKFNQLKFNIGAASGSLKQFASTKLSNLKSGLTGIKNTLTQGQTGAKGFVTALKNIGKISVTSLVNGVKNVGTQLKNGVSKAKEFASSLKQAASVTFNKLASGIKSAGSALGSAALSGAKVAAGALAAGTAAVGGLIAKGISYNNQMEQYQTSFTTLLEGNQAAADGLVSSLKEMADTTPFEMTDMSNAAQTLLGFGVAADKVMPSLQALGDVSQGNSERFSNLSLAFAQVQAAGKLTGQDLLQFINAGFNPLQEMSRTTGKSLAELKEEMSEGAISAEMVADAFQSATSEGGRFYQSMEKQSKTFSGQISTIKDNVNSLIGTLTKGLQQDLAANFLPQINESLSSLNSAFTSGGMEGFLNALPTAMDGIISAVAAKLQEGLPTIINIVVSALSSMANSIAEYLPSFVSTIGDGLLQLLQGLVDTLRTSGPQLISGVLDSLSQFTMGFLDTLPQLADVGVSLVTSLAQGVAQAAPMLIPAAVDAVMNFTNGIYNNIGSLISAGLQLVSGLVQGIVTAIPQLISSIPTLITSFINGITSNLPAIIEMGVQMLVQLVVGLVTAIPKLSMAVPKIVKALWDGLTSINWLDLGKNILSSIGDGIKSGLKSLFGIGEDSGEAVVEGYEIGSSGISLSAINSGTEAAQGFSSGITSNMGLATGAASNMSQNAASAFGSGSLLSNLEGADMTSGFASGINASGQTPVQEAQSISANVQTALDNANVSINNFMVQLTNTLTNAKSNISLWVSELSAEIQNGLKFDGTNGVITNFMIGLTNTLTSAKTNIVLWFSEIAAEVQAKTNAMISALQGFQTSLYNISYVLSNLSATGAGFTQLADAAEYAMSNMEISITSSVTNAQSKLSDGVKTMRKSVSDGMNQIASITKTKMSAFVSTISSGCSNAVSIVKSCVSNIRSAFSNINLYSVGTQMMNGLIRGMNGRRSSVISTAREIAQAASNAINSSLRIASPSKVTIESGEYVGQGLAVGMENMIPTVKQVSYELGEGGLYGFDYTPESSSVTNNTQAVENNTISPVFNLTINGGNVSESRATERQVKRWVKEAIEEIADSMDRRRPRLQQI